jgi:hypothetical protein
MSIPENAIKDDFFVWSISRQISKKAPEKKEGKWYRVWLRFAIQRGGNFKSSVENRLLKQKFFIPVLAQFIHR